VLSFQPSDGVLGTDKLPFVPDVIAAEVHSPYLDSPGLARFAQAQGCSAFCKGVATQVIVARHSGLNVMAFGVVDSVSTTSTHFAQLQPASMHADTTSAAAQRVIAAAVTSAYKLNF